MNNRMITQTDRFPLRIKDTEESISQNIRNILLTNRGAVPFRPGFGLGAEELLGGSMKSIDLAYEVTDQLSRYEKRIKVKQVVSKETAPGRMEVEIRYELTATGETDSLIIRNRRAAGGTASRRGIY